MSLPFSCTRFVKFFKEVSGKSVRPHQLRWRVTLDTLSHKIKFSPKPPTGGFAQFLIKKTVKWKTGTIENKLKIPSLGLLKQNNFIESN